MFQTERLKELRVQRNLTQSAVAEQINVSREAYSMYETGHRQPSCQSLAALSNFFHVSCDYLIGLCNLPVSLADLNPNALYILYSIPYLDEISLEFIVSVIKIRHPSFNSQPDTPPTKSKRKRKNKQCSHSGGRKKKRTEKKGST